MKLFNVRSLMTVILIATCTFTSCKKDKDVAAPPDSVIIGSWEGLYGGLNVTPSLYFAFTIQKDGTLQVKANDKNNPPIVGKGTWTLKENEFKAVYQYDGQSNKYNVVAKFDEAQKKLTGNWGDGEKNADNGDFYMNKQ